MTVFQSVCTINAIKDGAFFGRPRFDIGNSGFSNASATVGTMSFSSWSVRSIRAKPAVGLVVLMLVAAAAVHAFWPSPAGAAPAPQAAGAVTLTWLDFGQDRVGAGGNPNPADGGDGHFRVSLTGAEGKTVSVITLYSSDAAGNPAFGQVWNTAPDGAWILGVYRDGTRLNPQDTVLSDRVTGPVAYEVFGNDSGYFKSGQYFGVTVRFTDNTEVKATTSVGAVAAPTPTATPTPLPVGTQSCVPPPASLVGWWRGEGNADDRQGNHGALRNGASFVPGQVGRGFSFDGVDDFVQVPDSSSWAFGAGEFTLELWVSFSSVKAINILMGSDDGPGHRNKWLFWLNSGQLQLHINSPAIPGGNGINIGSGLFSPVRDRWHHLAVTRSGSSYTFYVDGRPLSSATNALPVPDANGPLTIGQAENLGFIHGRMDEAAIYNRALSAGEIQAIFAAGGAGKCAAGVAPAPPAAATPQPRVTPPAPAFPAPISTSTVLMAPERSVGANATVTVPLQLERATRLGSINFALRYDARVVKVGQVQVGDLVRGSLFQASTREDGVVRFGVAAPPGAGISGDGPVAHMELRAVGSLGSRTELVLEELLATDAAGARVALNLRHGRVTIQAKLRGDYDGDGRLTAKDALAALRMSIRDLAEDLVLDLDNDGRVTAEDARRILAAALDAQAQASIPAPITGGAAAQPATPVPAAAQAASLVPAGQALATTALQLSDAAASLAGSFDRFMTTDPGAVSDTGRLIATLDGLVRDLRRYKDHIDAVAAAIAGVQPEVSGAGPQAALPYRDLPSGMAWLARGWPGVPRAYAAEPGSHAPAAPIPGKGNLDEVLNTGLEGAEKCKGLYEEMVRLPLASDAQARKKAEADACYRDLQVELTRRGFRTILTTGAGVVAGGVTTAILIGAGAATAPVTVPAFLVMVGVKVAIGTAVAVPIKFVTGWFWDYCTAPEQQKSLPGGGPLRAPPLGDPLLDICAFVQGKGESGQPMAVPAEGTGNLTITIEGYEPVILTGVTLQRGKTTTVPVTLRPLREVQPPVAAAPAPATVTVTGQISERNLPNYGGQFNLDIVLELKGNVSGHAVRTVDGFEFRTVGQACAYRSTATIRFQGEVTEFYPGARFVARGTYTTDAVQVHTPIAKGPLNPDGKPCTLPDIRGSYNDKAVFVFKVEGNLRTKTVELGPPLFLNEPNDFNRSRQTFPYQGGP